LDFPAGLKILAMGSSSGNSRGRIKGAGSSLAGSSPTLPTLSSYRSHVNKCLDLDCSPLLLGVGVRSIVGGLGLVAGRAPAEGGQRVPGEEGRGFSPQETIRPPAAQVDAGLGGLGPVLECARGPYSDRTGGPPRGGLVAGRIVIEGDVPRRGGHQIHEDAT